MQFVTDQLKLLGLNEREIKVFTAIATFGRMNMTKVAGRASVPRTTVDAIVRRLEAQGIVTREKVSRHWEYSVQSTELAKQLDDLERKLVGTSVKSAPVHYDEKFVVSDLVSRTEQELLEGLHGRGGERSTVIIGGSGTISQGIDLLKLVLEQDLVPDVLVGTHDVEGIMQQSAVLAPLVPKEPSLLIRLPQSLTDASSHVLVLRDSVFVAATGNSYLSISETHVAASWFSLVRAAREAGWATDLKTYMESL